MAQKIKILILQQLYFDVQDITCCTFKNLNRVREVMIKYESVLVLLNKKDPAIFGNLLHIGLNEILDHYNLLDLRSSNDIIDSNFNDLKIYLQESLLDCRGLLIHPISAY